MITVNISTEPEYSVIEVKLEETIKKTLTENGLTKDCSVDVAIVGNQTMDQLVREYYTQDPDDEYDHPILTFPTNELKEEFLTPKGEIQSLGEMVISYPSAKWRAEEKNIAVDDMVCELAAHGSLHLLGIHHDH